MALSDGLTDEERDGLIADVEKVLEIITDDTDVLASIKARILAVVGYLQNGGTDKDNLLSPLGIACIALGVNDLMERKAGEISFSPAFNNIAMQIARG